VQDKLAASRQERALAVGAEAPSLLVGYDVDSSHKESQEIPLLRLGVASRWDHSRAQKGMRVPAGDLEALVLDRLRAFFSSRIDVSDALASLDLEAHSLDAALRNAFGLSERWLAAPPVVMKSLHFHLIRLRIELDPLIGAKIAQRGNQLLPRHC
jgi:site-specific DNA recombinase